MILQMKEEEKHYCQSPDFVHKSQKCKNWSKWKCEEKEKKWKKEEEKVKIKKMVPEYPKSSTRVKNVKIDPNGDWHRSPWSCLNSGQVKAQTIKALHTCNV